MKIRWLAILLVLGCAAGLALSGCGGDKGADPIVTINPLVGAWDLTTRIRDGQNIELVGNESLMFYQDNSGRCAGFFSLDEEYYFRNYFEWEVISAGRLAIYLPNSNPGGDDIQIGNLSYSISGNTLTITSNAVNDDQSSFIGETTRLRRG